MAFWKLAYEMKWVTAEKLLLVVRTDENPHGEITKEEYQTITGFEYPNTN